MHLQEREWFLIRLKFCLPTEKYRRVLSTHRVAQRGVCICRKKSKQEEGECNEVDEKASKRIRNACHRDSQLVCSTPNRVRAIHAE